MLAWKNCGKNSSEDDQESQQGDSMMMFART